MENVDPRKILEKLVNYFQYNIQIIVHTRSPWGPTSFILKTHQGNLQVTNNGDTTNISNIGVLIGYLDQREEHITEIALVMIVFDLDYAETFKIYSDRLSYYGCDEQLVKRKFELFYEYTIHLGRIKMLNFFISEGLRFLKLKADRVALESENQERSEQKAKEQQKFNDSLVRKLTNAFGAQGDIIDYDHVYDFTCEGENQFNIRLTRIVDITLPQKIKELNNQIIDIYSKIPNNKEVLPQFIRLIKRCLDDQLYDTFIQNVIDPLNYRLNESMNTQVVLKKDLIEETNSLREASEKMPSSFGKRSKLSLLRLKIVNAEIKYLSI